MVAIVVLVLSFRNLNEFLYLPEVISDLELFSLGREDTRPDVVSEFGACVAPRSLSKVIPTLTESDEPTSTEGETSLTPN